MRAICLISLLFVSSLAVGQDVAVGNLAATSSSSVFVATADIWTPPLDQSAEAVKRWGSAAYLGIMPGVTPPMYEVGFISIFGYTSKIVVGRGTSWKAAFDEADMRMHRGPEVGPTGGPR